MNFLSTLESYGALLLPDVKSSEDTLGSGAVADIFSVADGIHVSLGFNGIFTSKGLYSYSVIYLHAYKYWPYSKQCDWYFEID